MESVAREWVFVFCMGHFTFVGFYFTRVIGLADCNDDGPWADDMTGEGTAGCPRGGIEDCGTPTWRAGGRWDDVTVKRGSM
jgi:hypothetical protein